MDNILNLIVIPENIELRQNNPYSIGNVFIFEEGDYELERQPLLYVKSINDKYVTTVQGDTLGSIAHEHYGNSKYWWIILDVNDVDYIGPLFEVPDGTTLLIPDMDKIKILNNG